MHVSILLVHVPRLGMHGCLAIQLVGDAPSKCTERLAHLLILAHVHILESYKHTLHLSSLCVCTCMGFDTPLP